MINKKGYSCETVVKYLMKVLEMLKVPLLEELHLPNYLSLLKVSINFEAEVISK